MAQLWTWQAGDISANDLYRGDLQMALAGIKAKVLLMPSATDLYFQTDDNKAELPHLKYARLVEIPSVWGHRAGNPPPIPRTPPSSTSRSRRCSPNKLTSRVMVRPCPERYTGVHA